MAKQLVIESRLDVTGITDFNRDWRDKLHNLAHEIAEKNQLLVESLVHLSNIEDGPDDVKDLIKRIEKCLGVRYEDV